jgi:DNA invertase Pin-like site-specific DNA recombinase
MVHAVPSLARTLTILHQFAAQPEKERAMISTRTKAALAAAKAGGVFGGPKLAQAQKVARRPLVERQTPRCQRAADHS